MPTRRFPPPVEELDACLVLRDSNGQQIAYVYFENVSPVGDRRYSRTSRLSREFSSARSATSNRRSALNGFSMKS
jgi:hypothetical protein